MPNPVIAKRVMQFEAGPQRETFYACEEHLLNLIAGEVSCFLRIEGFPTEVVSDPEEDECWFCREG